MAALSRDRLTVVCRRAVVNALDNTLARLMPRRCTVIATGMMLTGFAIALLMTAQLLPTTLLLAFVALALLGVGGGLLLTGWGEI